MTDRKNYQAGKRDQNDTSKKNLIDNVGSGRSIGRGMDSPDSTEAVLDASTGEPDPRARGEGSITSGSERDRNVARDKQHRNRK